MTALAERVDAYVVLRRAMGYRLQHEAGLLARFVAELDRAGLDRVTTDAAVAWATAPPVSAARMARRLSIVRGFATYLAGFDARTEVPPVNLLPGGRRRRAPHAFTAAEVGALMTAARELPDPVRAASFETLIGLMAATGLRTSEALDMDRTDFDAATGALTVRTAKTNATRWLPLHPTTTAALASYLDQRDRLCPHPVSPALLIDERGERLRGQKLSATFRDLLTAAGIATPVGCRGPRLHDLRHRFAVATVTDWHAAGVDVQSRLPVLSGYLGHLDPADTYWYLDTVPELMAVTARRLERFWEQER